MSPFTEVRLSGSQATLPGVMRHINRRLAGGPFSRVEVVFSTQAAGRVEPSLARNQIKQLLREHGMRNVAVSARAHAALLDDASGEHLIRLYPDMSQARDAGTHDIAQPASSPKQQAAGRASWLPSRALRWLPEGLRRRLRSQDSPAPQPAVSAAQAAAVLRQAVATAARDQAARAQHGPWAHAEVRVSLQTLDESLRPLVMGDLARSQESIAQQLSSLQQPVTPWFTLHYVFRAPTMGEGTSYSSDHDIEVLLRSVPYEPELGVGSAPPVTPTLLPQDAASEATLLPDSARPMTLRARLTGTLEGAFEQALELPLSSLPARIDRETLARAGLSGVRPELLALVSNRAPLRIAAGRHGALELHAARRDGSDGPPVPLYFARSTLAPLPAVTALPPGGLDVVISDPAGTWDPKLRRRLPALVMELRSF